MVYDINDLLSSREVKACEEIINITTDKTLKEYLRKRLSKHYIAVSLRDIYRRSSALRKRCMG